jgi:hypothetical protein
VPAMWHCPAAPQAAHRTRASLVSSGACHPHNQPSMLPLQACAALPAGGRVSACLMSVLKKAAMPLSSREAKGAVYCTENTEAWSRGGAKVSARLRRGVCACVWGWGGGGHSRHEASASSRSTPPAHFDTPAERRRPCGNPNGCAAAHGQPPSQSALDVMAGWHPSCPSPSQLPAAGCQMLWLLRGSRERAPPYLDQRLVAHHLVQLVHVLVQVGVQRQQRPAGGQQGGER